MSVQAAIVHIIIWIVTGIAVGCGVVSTHDQMCFWSFLFPMLASLAMIYQKN